MRFFIRAAAVVLLGHSINHITALPMPNQTPALDSVRITSDVDSVRITRHVDVSAPVSSSDIATRDASPIPKEQNSCLSCLKVKTREPSSDSSTPFKSKRDVTVPASTNGVCASCLIKRFSELLRKKHIIQETKRAIIADLIISRDGDTADNSKLWGRTAAASANFGEGGGNRKFKTRDVKIESRGGPYKPLKEGNSLNIGQGGANRKVKSRGGLSKPILKARISAPPDTLQRGPHASKQMDYPSRRSTSWDNLSSSSSSTKPQGGPYQTHKDVPRNFPKGTDKRTASSSPAPRDAKLPPHDGGAIYVTREAKLEPHDGRGLPSPSGDSPQALVPRTRDPGRRRSRRGPPEFAKERFDKDSNKLKIRSANAESGWNEVKDGKGSGVGAEKDMERANRRDNREWKNRRSCDSAKRDEQDLQKRGNRC